MLPFSFLLLAASLIPKTRSAECTVAHSATEDDSPSILKAFTDCQVDSVITFSKANYSASTPVSLTGLKNVTVHLNGNLLLPQNVSAVQHSINTTLNQPSTYATPWFYIQGEDVSIIGSDDPEWGAFHGFGEQWWNVGNRILRPQLATFNVTNGLLRKLKVIKPIAWGWNLPGKNLRVEDHFVDAAPHNGTRDTTVSFPFNTDGLNLSGQNITVDGYYGHNGDDCISVINGAKDIVAQNGFCGFSSHGLSIGSLGKGGAVQTVQNVLFKNWTMDGAVYGARFKSWTGGQGFADNVTWEDITLVGVSTGIFITQNYYDQDKGARPTNTNNTSTKVSNFKFKNFKGSLATNWTDGTCISNPCWNFVQSIDNTKAIIFDLFPGTALNVSVENIDVQPHDLSSNSTTVICDSSALAPGEQATLGFLCKTGPLVATEIKASSGAGKLAQSGIEAMLGLILALVLGSLL
ncbi:glycoside hydrolase family 28 protein [Macrolepiota fuliginosa MF-IS2]|uniref:galacturonan 1,4-alpha-galacturonidase n=1 Tax=Macrolepiota fuliginosa MF-IS2 TaxID=1400762 RepID=A0A9P6C0T9_9AGAR|nr:glycoside hydrolase family 28 protein [Macrolepiota fuliginosa MF-IS2]